MWEINCEETVTQNNDDVLEGLFSRCPLLGLLVKIHVRFQALLADGNGEVVGKCGKIIVRKR